MASLPLVSSPLRSLMVVVGLGMGALDVKEKVAALEKARQTPTARAIGEQMFIRDPYFVVKSWGAHVATCATDTWCYAPPPGKARAAPTALPSWAKVGPVYIARMAVFPIAQTGRTLFAQGWTARAVFLFAFTVAFLLLFSRPNRSNDVPGSVFVGVLGFLVISVALSFAFNLLLRLGNAVAGYWGVLAAIGAGIFVTLELAGKVREFIALFRGESQK